MDSAKFTLRDLFEAGVHFGHRTRRWNPKMAPFIYGEKDGIHIIDLQQTVGLLASATKAIKEVIELGGKILFVGTKRQASGPVAEYASSCNQYFVNHRWLGGMLTNWDTISKSIKKLQDLDSQLKSQNQGLTKKELLNLERNHDKLNKTLGGIKDMGGIPDMLFVIDTVKESTAVKEANKIGIPVVAVLDTNSNPDMITHPIPGNDDASNAIHLFCRIISESIGQVKPPVVKHDSSKEKIADKNKKQVGTKQKNPPVDRREEGKKSTTIKKVIEKSAVKKNE
jgi:small subunit ribosomal protein S2